MRHSGSRPASVPKPMAPSGGPESRIETSVKFSTLQHSSTLVAPLNHPSYLASPLMRDLQRLQTRHLRLADLYLQGMTVAAIAREMEMHENSVSRIVASAVFQDFVARRRREKQELTDTSEAEDLAKARRGLASASVKAVDTLSTLMDNGPASVRLQSAMGVLEKAFKLGESKPSGVNTIVGQLNVQVLLSALKESTEGGDEYGALIAADIDGGEGGDTGVPALPASVGGE